MYNLIAFKQTIYLHAEEVLEQIDATSIVQAWFTLAGTNVDFTSRTSPPRRTFTRVFVNSIHTFATIHARFASTVVDIVLKFAK